MKHQTGSFGCHTDQDYEIEARRLFLEVCIVMAATWLVFSPIVSFYICGGIAVVGIIAISYIYSMKNITWCNLIHDTVVKELNLDPEHVWGYQIDDWCEKNKVKQWN